MGATLQMVLTVTLVQSSDKCPTPPQKEHFILKYPRGLRHSQ